MHIHSTYSDGTLTPKELLELAAKKNIKAIALTDHDTLEGIEEALKYSQIYNVELVQGIELSTYYDNTEIHIVGLFINNNNRELISKLNLLKESRLNRNLAIISKLNNISIPITYEEVKKESKGKIITRAHFSKVLIKKGFSNSINDCFNQYLNPSRPAYIKRETLKLEETINLIKNAGGIAILAHPLIYDFNDDKLNKMLNDICHLGLNGIECYYPTHTKDETEYVINLANKYNLAYSGGSDFHGQNKPNLELGTGYGKLNIPYEVLEYLKKEVL